jgi:hypothetical protein
MQTQQNRPKLPLLRNPRAARSYLLAVARRLLVTITAEARLARAQPFALRKTLSNRIEGLTLDMIPRITATRTGWAIHPLDDRTKQRFLKQDAQEVIKRVMSATAIDIPQKWYSYALPYVPSAITSVSPDLESVIITKDLVTEEAQSQTRVKPVNVHPSRHGANPVTGRSTWIVSFLTPVRPFTLFAASGISRLCDKRPAIVRHDPGCQGWCAPSKCTRQPRCSTCSMRLEQHDGPSGVLCSHASMCANCHGPFTSGHDNCPAAPVRKNGQTIFLNKKELAKVRRQGAKAYARRQESERQKQADTSMSSTADTPASTRSETPASSAKSGSPSSEFTVVESKRSKRKKVLDGATEPLTPNPVAIRSGSKQKETPRAPPQRKILSRPSTAHSDVSTDTDMMDELDHTR